MIIRKYKDLAFFDHGWLKTRHHFSFADYFDPTNMGFGKIRVINDDLVMMNNGFPTHPHKNMEIISYVLNGEITHQDSMGNKRTLGRGDVQYMSAGTGVLHSEYNISDKELRFFQIWIIPDKLGLKPNYGDMKFEPEDRENKLLHLVSIHGGDGKINLNQNVDIFVTEINKNMSIDLELGGYHGFYIINMEGKSVINDNLLEYGDAIMLEENANIKVADYAHLLILRTIG
jgi:redox-sensitive bicupin YhaK (pirin superfamily)